MHFAVPTQYNPGFASAGSTSRRLLVEGGQKEVFMMSVYNKPPTSVSCMAGYLGIEAFLCCQEDSGQAGIQQQDFTSVRLQYTLRCLGCW